MFSKVVVIVIEFTEVDISCIQMFFTGFVLCQFEIIQTETRSQTLHRKTSPQSYKTLPSPGASSPKLG